MGPGVGEGSADASGERPATHLDEHPVEVGAGLGAQLPTQGPTGVERQRVLRALDAERDGAALDRFAESVDARIAGRIVVAPGTHRHRGPQAVQRLDDRGLAHVGTNTSSSR